MFENPEAEKEGIRRARFIGRCGFKKRGDETRERLRGCRVIARASVQRGGKTLVLAAAIVVMQPLVRPWRGRQPQRHHKARQHCADERETERFCMADDSKHSFDAS